MVTLIFFQGFVWVRMGYHTHLIAPEGHIKMDERLHHNYGIGLRNAHLFC